MDKRVVVYKVMRMVFAPLFYVLFQPKIIGRVNIPKEGAAVIAGNHKHALDPILVDISTRRTVRTLAKKDLHDGPFGWLFRSSGTIPVDLHAKHNPEALKAAKEALHDGELVNVSPEAKRNYTDELLLPFKYGAAVMSEDTGASLVPYAIVGRYKPFGGLTIIFGKPFKAVGDAEMTNRKLYNSIAALLKKVMPKEELQSKKITSFEEWSSRNEKTS
ncbi:lysophospholipid acyltransferase family protein [Ruminococcus albus]|uniref:1-acyl-sn-glycerol-3-phosphate acyltransferase n=1 Tax=Ruminococcus albus TaxID=1264 RepID=A0A1H7JFW9_RUMAL|nr:lysophospholipid acyltransferase family protein [Ruminococcus albus]SEK73509.1 1-acyl-sn-glycerol-3-phosphate acyltransferase [Ruminococcus albus]